VTAVLLHEENVNGQRRCKKHDYTVPASSNKLDKWNDIGPWYEVTHGSRRRPGLASPCLRLSAREV